MALVRPDSSYQSQLQQHQRMWPPAAAGDLPPAASCCAGCWWSADRRRRAASWGCAPLPPGNLAGWALLAAPQEQEAANEKQEVRS